MSQFMYKSDLITINNKATEYQQLITGNCWKSWDCHNSIYNREQCYCIDFFDEKQNNGICFWRFGNEKIKVYYNLQKILKVNSCRNLEVVFKKLVNLYQITFFPNLL